MTHFQTPTTHMSSAKLLELREILETPVSQDVFFKILNEIDRGLVRSSPQHSELRLGLQALSRCPNPKQTDLLMFVETKLIPEPSTSSDTLRKKRRQTPKRRYTFKKHR